jgi:hypothetical protein
MKEFGEYKAEDVRGPHIHWILDGYRLYLFFSDPVRGGAYGLVCSWSVRFPSFSTKRIIVPETMLTKAKLDKAKLDDEVLDMGGLPMIDEQPVFERENTPEDHDPTAPKTIKPLPAPQSPPMISLEPSNGDAVDPKQFLKME